MIKKPWMERHEERKKFSREKPIFKIQDRGARPFSPSPDGGKFKLVQILI